MKKFLLSIPLLFAALSANAGDRAENMRAFRHLSIGVEAGTTGTGVSLYMPISDNHLVLSVGYNFAPKFMKFTAEDNLKTGSLNNTINLLNSAIDQINNYASEYNVPFGLDKHNNVDGAFKAKGPVNLSNMKVMLEYYPSRDHTFHFTAGVFVGDENLVDFEGHSSKGDWASYETLNSNIATANAAIGLINTTAGKKLIETVDPTKAELTFDFDNNTYRVVDFDHDGTGDIKGSAMVNKVKPYFGIGFGRSISNKRVGFQFELGAWYHGKPSIQFENPTSGNSGVFDADSELSDVMKVVNKLVVYPQITFRFTGRLF